MDVAASRVALSKAVAAGLGSASEPPVPSWGRLRQPCHSQGGAPFGLGQGLGSGEGKGSGRPRARGKGSGSGEG